MRAEQRQADAEAQQPVEQEPPAERPRLFRMPNVREDLLALPTIFLTRRLLWLPLLLLVVGFGLTMMLPGLVAEVAAIADLYIQFFFVPPALFTFFIAGFVAPRASYLVGLIYGLIAGVMWSTIIVTSGLTLATGEPATTTSDAGGVFMQMLLVGALYGTLAAAFAAWYRDFLRGMQERGKARRADQEAKERAKRRDERQEARRIAKRPSS
jgi:signal transduction histidine kinase